MGPRLGCEIEGASLNLFQYLERESKELALRWIPAFSSRTLRPSILAFSLFLSFSTLSPLLVGPSDFQRVVYTIALPLSGRVFIVKSFGMGSSP